MNRSTFWMIKYMNGSVFSKARYMNVVGFEILARTPVPPPPPPPPPPRVIQMDQFICCFFVFCFFVFCCFYLFLFFVFFLFVFFFFVFFCIICNPQVARAGAFSRDFTLNMSPQCRALKTEKLKAPAVNNWPFQMAGA